MFRKLGLFVFGCLVLGSKAQNDADAIRYSQTGVGGSARFVSMGGAFGAIGADPGVTSFNPAGLGIYRKGELSFSFGVQSAADNTSIYNNYSSTANRANVRFNNFGFVATITPKDDPDSRHVIAFTINQLQNFNNATRFSAYTNNSSIAKDMLILAKTYQTPLPDVTLNLDPSYEGMAFNTYLLDTTSDGEFFSNLDIKRSVKQTRDIITTGRTNDINFSYAYSFKDKFYFGASVGLPQVNYTSNTKHSEFDDKDSMRIITTSNGSYDTYLEPPLFYTSDGGFKSLTYEEYFKTTGSGLNLKLGGIYRLNDALRIGAYYHTPTIYWLQDNYYSDMSVSFDNRSNPYTITVPEEGGYYKYRIMTPARYSANVGFVINKKALIGVDYEFVNYKSARLSSDELSDFEFSNSLIKSVYSGGHNIRVGGEVNFQPFMVRLGYAMTGSPYGDVFSGQMVRNTVSAGLGYRSKGGFYLDLSLSRTMTENDYYFFSVLDTKGNIKQNVFNCGLTMGIKF
ncbi:MAG: outer membrane protein transport protein [Bacteroidia bacterium]|nr:outer membrane protein transport protein [Bacteroidia bacterium]